jgi:hypothetical protein
MSNTLLKRNKGSKESSRKHPEDSNLFSAQKVMLGGKRSPTEICLSCCKQLWPTSFMVRVAPRNEDAPFLKLAHSLVAIGMDYSSAGLSQHVLKGQAHAQRILMGTNQKFRSFQEICEFTWFLLARSADKNCFFLSGSWQIEDPDYKLFNALACMGYSRVLGSAKALGAGETASYGSSHLVEFLKHSRARGTWHVPASKVQFQISNGKTSSGYYQVGIDIPRPVNIKKTDEIGLFAGKKHVLCGKVPPKTFGQTKSFTFIKLEWHGTKKAGDALGHIFDFVKTRKSKGKRKKMQMKEHADKDQVQKFKELMGRAFTVEFSTGRAAKCLVDTELTLDEVCSRAKVIGLSYMHDLTLRLHRNCQISLQQSSSDSKISTVMIESLMGDAHDLIKEIDSDPTMDHINVRFGREVIFGANELLEASHLPNEQELRSQMVVYGLANVITTAVCDGDEDADQINITQLTRFFDTVNHKYGRDSSTTSEHATRTMELIGDGKIAPAAQFKLFLLQRFAAFPEQFHDLAEVIVPGKVGPRPPSLIPQSASSIPCAPRTLAPSAPRRMAPKSSKASKAPILTTSRTFKRQVAEIARILSKRQGFVLKAEIYKFCQLCNQWSSAGQADPKQAKDMARTICTQIGNGQRTTSDAFQTWMFNSYSELHSKSPEKWRDLHRMLLRRLIRAEQEHEATSKSSQRSKSKPRQRQTDKWYYYLDDNWNEQGPFDQNTMAYWVSEGHFKSTRLVCGVVSEQSLSSEGTYMTVSNSSVLAKFL